MVFGNFFSKSHNIIFVTIIIILILLLIYFIESNIMTMLQTNTMITSAGELRHSVSDMKSGKRRMKFERTNSQASVACYPSAAPCATTEDGDGDYSSVRFERSVTIRFTQSHHDYTPREIKDCFYQCYELREIKAKCAEDLRRFRKKENGDDQADEIYDDDETCYIRGLETLEEVTHERKHRLRAEAANKVFDAEDDGCDDITIAREYSLVAAQSQTWANIVGLRDQRSRERTHTTEIIK
jgi:hypothetical protein